MGISRTYMGSWPHQILGYWRPRLPARASRNMKLI